VLAVLAVFVAGCGDPPSRELHEAHGAIEAARAAGAERYAPDEFAAAETALQRAQEAVSQRDYRLALNHALDSHERAQNAAREAAVNRAQTRSQAERMLADITAALAEATRRIEEADAAKVPRKAIAEPQEAVASAQRAVQEAGSALGEEDYLRAQEVLKGRVPAVRSASAQIAQIVAAHPPRPARPARRSR
jgi:uncharacterized protein with von Willebrand factor type A (vWA) domain